jgi:hypothetical protein
MEGGDLRTLLRSQTELSLELNVNIMCDVCAGMVHLTLEGIGKF